MMPSLEREKKKGELTNILFHSEIHVIYDIQLLWIKKTIISRLIRSGLFERLHLIASCRLYILRWSFMWCLCWKGVWSEMGWFWGVETLWVHRSESYIATTNFWIVDERLFATTPRPTTVGSVIYMVLRECLKRTSRDSINSEFQLFQNRPTNRRMTLKIQTKKRLHDN